MRRSNSRAALTCVSTCVKLFSSIQIGMMMTSMCVGMGHMVHLHGGERTHIIQCVSRSSGSGAGLGGSCGGTTIGG